MADTRPIDRLRIQGNAPVAGDKTTKKLNNNNTGQQADAPDTSRRYLLHDRITWSDYGSRSNGKDPYQVYLNIRGRTICWYSDVTNSSSTQQPLLTYRRNVTHNVGSNGVDTLPTNNDSPSGVPLLSSGNDQLVGNTEQLSTNNEQNQLPGLNNFKRDNRLRHSYHGVGSLSLTGQKLTTPRDFHDANDRLKCFSLAQPPLPKNDQSDDQLASESMPDISASSPVHRRHDRMEAAPLVATQRHTRSGFLRQCLQIHKPKLVETDQVTESVDNDNSILPSLTTTMTHSTAEVDSSTVIKRYKFNSVDSYLYFNSKFSKISPSDKNGSSLGKKSFVSLMTQLADIGSNKFVKAQSHLTHKLEVPVSFPTVKKYPNINGHMDVSYLSVVGSGKVGISLQENKQNLRNNVVLLRDVEINSKENMSPADTTYKTDDVMSYNKEMKACLVHHVPSLICIPLSTSDIRQTEESETKVKILKVRKLNNV